MTPKSEITVYIQDGMLHAYKTGETLRAATPEEIESGDEAFESDGVGLFRVAVEELAVEE